MSASSDHSERAVQGAGSRWAHSGGRDGHTPAALSLQQGGLSGRFRTGCEERNSRVPKVAAHYLLEKFRAAGITKAFLVMKDGKWDIPSYFREGDLVGLSLAYIVIAGSLGPPDTLDRAYPFLEQKRVAFGFPDILFGPDDAYARLITRQEQTGADVVLGLHEIEDPRVWDMVDCDKAGLVRDIVMKPASTLLTHGWCCAVWTPAFTEFLHSFLRADETRRNLDRLASKVNDPGGDLAVGVVLQAALRPGSQSKA